MKKITLLLIIILIQKLSIGQINDSLRKPYLKFDLTFFDLPYQFDAAKTVNNGTLNFKGFMKGYANPSMQQSLYLTTDIYSITHYGIDKLFKVKKKYRDTKYKFLHISSLLLSNFILTYAPTGDGWLHEEYHRAVMNRFHVNSFDDMNTFPIGAELVSVNNVKDEDLIRFKSESPADFIRMHVAGIEGGYLLIDRLQKHNFFYQQNLTHEILYALTTINSISYVVGSSKPDVVDVETDKMNKKEKTIEERDFTGFDFSAWAYDLFNPNEAYQDRGVHILGNGIDRYIKTTDLSSDALDYLEKQGNLQFLNLLSPMLFWQKSIKLNDNINFNFAIRHLLTSFGNDISLNVFLQINENNFIVRYHHANNYKNAFPAIELELFEYPINYANNIFLLSPRVITGTQPKDQSFYTKNHEFLGSFACRIDWVLKYFSPWVEFSAKTDGWVAGNEFLNNNFSCNLGLSLRLR